MWSLRCWSTKGGFFLIFFWRPLIKIEYCVDICRWLNWNFDYTRKPDRRKLHDINFLLVCTDKIDALLQSQERIVLLNFSFRHGCVIIETMVAFRQCSSSYSQKSTEMLTDEIVYDIPKLNCISWSDELSYHNDGISKVNQA